MIFTEYGGILSVGVRWDTPCQFYKNFAQFHIKSYAKWIRSTLCTEYNFNVFRHLCPDIKIILSVIITGKSFRCYRYPVQFINNLSKNFPTTGICLKGTYVVFFSSNELKAIILGSGRLTNLTDEGLSWSISIELTPRPRLSSNPKSIYPLYN
jgi:hypothetical protein